MRLVLPILVASIAGCSFDSDPPRQRSAIVGTASDAVVAAGEYDGYRVIRPCPSKVAVGAPLAVKGKGAVKLTTQTDLSGWSSRRLSPLMGTGSVSTFWGYGLGCEDAVGASITLSDWRAVDGLVTRIGEYLRQDGVDVEVSIRVESPPVAEADSR